jgi:dihydrofolate reductase
MTRMFFFQSVSLDGFFEGPDHDISWHNVDAEFNKFAIGQLRETDTMLFGRRTYQLFEGYWPKMTRAAGASDEDVEIANLINNMNKIVFSRTLSGVVEKENWWNVRLVREADPEEIRSWNQQPGKALSVAGNNLAVSLARMGLIDEFRIMTMPVVLGQGNRLLSGVNEKMKLKLVSTRTFRSGNVLLCYRRGND